MRFIGAKKSRVHLSHRKLHRFTNIHYTKISDNPSVHGQSKPHMNVTMLFLFGHLVIVFLVHCPMTISVQNSSWRQIQLPPKIPAVPHSNQASEPKSKSSGGIISLIRLPFTYRVPCCGAPRPSTWRKTEK